MMLTFVLAVSVRSEFLFFLLGFEVMICAGALILVRWQSGHIHMRVVLPEQTAYRGEKFCIKARITNDSRIPVTGLYARLAIRVFPHREELLVAGKIFLAPHEEGDICFDMDCTHTESLEIRADRLVITDFLGIAKRRCHVDMADRYIMYILPEQTDRDEALPESEGVFYSEDGEDGRSGDTDVDVSEIRQYRYGDAVKLIHWKLSARLDDLMVRELVDPTEKCMWLFVNLRENGKVNVRRDPDMWDKFVETVSGVSETLLRMEKRHVVCWIDCAGDRVSEHSVWDSESHQLMLMALLRMDTYESGDHTQLLEEINSDETKGTCIEINLQGDIVRSGRER